MFLDTQRAPQLTDQLKTGMFIKVRGVTTIDKFDSDLTIGNIYGIMKIADFRQKRSDTWPRKRVELHCHTKMSAMDAVSEPGDLVKAAASWGHKAIAITDHGVVQGLPDAYKAIPEDSDFKVIYGCEGYLVNDLVETAVNSRGQALEGDFVVFDLETTGFSPVENRIIEIGAVKVSGGKIVDRFSDFSHFQRIVCWLRTIPPLMSASSKKTAGGWVMIMISHLWIPWRWRASCCRTSENTSWTRLQRH